MLARPRRWHRLPRIATVVAVVAGLALTYGAAVHLVELASGQRGWSPEVPGWLGAYFAVLVVLDPAAALLLALRTRCGVVLAGLVLLSDALANGYANFAVDRVSGFTTGRVFTVVIALLAVLFLAVSPDIWPRPTHEDDQ